MKYVYGVLIPVLLQVLVVFLLIQMNTGNGSWVGLGAFLIGMIAIPGTALLNALYIKNSSNKKTVNVIFNCFVFAAVAPFVCVLLLLIG